MGRERLQQTTHSKQITKANSEITNQLFQLFLLSISCMKSKTLNTLGVTRPKDTEEWSVGLTGHRAMQRVTWFNMKNITNYNKQTCLTDSAISGPIPSPGNNVALIGSSEVSEAITSSVDGKTQEKIRSIKLLWRTRRSAMRPRWSLEEGLVLPILHYFGTKMISNKNNNNEATIYSKNSIT